MTRRILAAIGVLALAVGLAACTGQNDDLADTYREGRNQGFISGDGRITEIPLDERGDAVEQRGVLGRKLVGLAQNTQGLFRAVPVLFDERRELAQDSRGDRRALGLRFASKALIDGGPPRVVARDLGDQRGRFFGRPLGRCGSRDVEGGPMLLKWAVPQTPLL
jgi:hypothetical protein